MRAHNFIDRSGEKYGHITILKYIRTNEYRKPVYVWACVCGTKRESIIGRILRGETISCGCVNAKNHTKHGMSKSRVYNIWKCIKQRCENKNVTQWRYYGGRGVRVYKKWSDDFCLFYNYIGDPPTTKHSIDRYPDNNGNYEPGNVRWATKSQQSFNRRKPTSRTTQ